MRDFALCVCKVLLTIGLLLPLSVNAQTTHKCGYKHLAGEVINKYPHYEDTLQQLRDGVYHKGRSAAKTTLSGEVMIPVIFHIVITQRQLDFLGGVESIERRLDSQMVVINRDFAGLNNDRAAVPSAFTDVFGSSNIRFALAHTAPDGSATPGYEITITQKEGFEVDYGMGSGFGFSSAKYEESGGAAAWDPYSYLNVWVINPLENGAGSNIVGLAVPPYFTREYSNIPTREEGVLVHHRAFGKRTFLGDLYVSGSDAGRTLTHELGHYFGLFHIWGDDDGLCPGNGGSDDGIADTPPQAYSSSGCNTFPETDQCSPDGSGIMFMNYMDYSNDSCSVMFTEQQVSRMQDKVVAGGYAYSLSLHPWLLKYPDGSTEQQVNDYVIYPNPTDEQINIVFRHPSQGLQYIRLIDILGRVVSIKEYDTETAYYSFSANRLHAGMYFVEMLFNSERKIEKVLVR